MTTAAQRRAARENLKKARKVWQQMPSRQRSRSQPEGPRRARPGSSGEGGFFRIEVRPKSEFETFRTQDVGKKGGIERVAGKRGSGSWSTQTWLISKRHAHVEGGSLVADTADARKVLKALGSTPKRIRGDRYKAAPRPNVPERAKPTAAQKRARSTNIRKARATRGSAPGKSRSKSTRWSGEVTRNSDALDLQDAVFKKKRPLAIALSLKRSAEASDRRKGTPYRSAMSMLTFYINRAGKNLSKGRRDVLEKAKGELRKLFGR
jgi:hypothetical protein